MTESKEIQFDTTWSKKKCILTAGRPGPTFGAATVLCNEGREGTIAKLLSRNMICQKLGNPIELSQTNTAEHHLSALQLSSLAAAAR